MKALRSYLKLIFAIMLFASLPALGQKTITFVNSWHDFPARRYTETHTAGRRFTWNRTAGTWRQSPGMGNCYGSEIPSKTRTCNPTALRIRRSSLSDPQRGGEKDPRGDFVGP